MPNLTPTSSFDDVPELETSTLALGGPGGPMNLPAQALLNRTQWLHDNAVAGSSSPYAAGTGTANACAAAYTPAITALADGMKLRFLAVATNTGAATFAPDALTARPILGGDYAALQGGEILADGVVELTWNAALTSWVITAQAGGSPQVPDATQSKHAASKGQVDQITTDLASTAAGKGAGLIGYLSGTLKAFLDSLPATGSAVGSALVGFIQSGTGAVARTVQDKARERVSLLDFIPTAYHAAIADGTTTDDVTTYVQAAYDYSAANQIRLYVPAGVYRLTDTINATSQGVTLEGDGVNYVIGALTTGENTRGPGTWLWFDHLNKGLNIGQGTHTLRGLGTFRSQVAPGPNPYTPASADWDIYSVANDLVITDLCLRNATKGIFNDGGGRVAFDRIYGQPLTYGIDTSQATDVCRYNNIHFWPFWSNNADVRNYMKQNASAFRFGRADNPDLNGLFALGYKYGIHAYPSASGPFRKARIVNCDFDLGQKALYLEGDAARVYCANVSAQQAYGDYTGTPSLVDVTGSGCRLHMANCELTDSRGPHVNIAGSSTVRVSNMNTGPWDRNSSGTAAYAVGSGSRLVTDTIEIGTGVPTVVFSGSGLINAPLDRKTITATTDANGYIANMPHRAPCAPTGGTVTVHGSAGYHASLYNVTTTTVGFRIFNGTSALASTSVTLTYDLIFAQ